MADSKVSALAAAGAYNDADILYIIQGGISVKTTWGSIKTALRTAIEYPEVANYAALPAAASHSGEIYVCLASQGSVWLLTLKDSGFYLSDGAVWTRLGALPADYFTDSVLSIADDADPTKIVKFSCAAVATLTTRTFTWPDADGTVMLVGQAPTAHKTSHENGGADEISVAGLSGVLADAQPPIIGATGTTAVAGNDSRLTDERVPTAAGITTKLGTNKATVVDGDKIAMLNSAASDAPVHILWSLIKSTLKTYFDTIYQAAGSYLTSGGALGTPSSGTLTNCTGLPVAGAVMATARILGRTTAGSGAVEEITVGSGLSLSAGSLTATGGGGGTDIFDFTQLDAVATFGGSTLACNVPYRGTAVGTGALTTYAGSDFPAAEIRTGTTSGWGYYVAFWASSGTSNTFDLDETHTWMMQFHIRTGADIGNYRLLVGAVGTAGAAVPVAGIGVRFDTDASDTNFRLAAWDASTPTLGSDNLGAVAINTVYVVKIWCNADGTVRATVNGGTQSTLTTGFTATRVTPLFQLINSTTADKRMQCARFAFHIEGLSP